MKINVAIFLLPILIISCKTNSEKIHEYSITPVDIREVQLTDSFWLPKIRTIQNTTIAYAIDKCSKEGRLENFLIAGGGIKSLKELHIL